MSSTSGRRCCAQPTRGNRRRTGVIDTRQAAITEAVGLLPGELAYNRARRRQGIGQAANVAAGGGGGADPLGNLQSYRPTPVELGKPVRSVRFKTTPAGVLAERQRVRWTRHYGLMKFSSKPRVRRCKTPIGNARVGLARHEGGSHAKGLQSCANVWACPHCGPKIRAARMADVLLAFDRHAAGGGGFAFLTLTVAHELGEALAELLALLGGAWKSVAEQREYKEWRKRIELVGSITALEVTDGGNGWHPHRHVMLLTARPLSRDEVEALEAVLDELYGRWLVKRGRKRGGIDPETGRRVGVRLDFVPADDHGRREQLGRYITKLQAGFELTRGDLKQSRGSKGRLPVELLDIAMSGGEAAEQALARWREYETAMTGKCAVRFSKGLRAHLGMEASKTDEELAEEEVGGEADVMLSAPLWRRLKRDRRAHEVLQAHTLNGAAGVLRLLHLHYPGKYVAVEGEYGPGVLLVE